MRLACDAVLVAGFGSVVFGVWSIWHPLGWIVGGGALMAAAFFIGYSKK